MLHWAFAVSDIFEFYSPCCTYTGTNDKVIVDAVRLSRKKHDQPQNGANSFAQPCEFLLSGHNWGKMEMKTKAVTLLLLIWLYIFTLNWMVQQS